MREIGAKTLIGILILIICLKVTNVYGGFPSSDVYVIPASANTLGPSLEIKNHRSGYKIGDMARVHVEAKVKSNYFIARDTNHKRTAKYTFIGVKNLVLENSQGRILYQGDDLTAKEGIEFQITSEEDASIRVSGTFVCKAEKGRVAAGFPAYYMSKRFSKIKKLPLGIVDVGEEDETDEEILEEDIHHFLIPRVEHKARWIDLRQKKNLPLDSYWSMERIVLYGETDETIDDVKIYCKNVEGQSLKKNSITGFVGEMNLDEALGKKDIFSKEGRKELEIVFEGYSGGELVISERLCITVDDEGIPYRLHRKS